MFIRQDCGCVLYIDMVQNFRILIESCSSDSGDSIFVIDTDLKKDFYTEINFTPLDIDEIVKLANKIQRLLVEGSRFKEIKKLLSV